MHETPHSCRFHQSYFQSAWFEVGFVGPKQVTISQGFRQNVRSCLSSRLHDNAGDQAPVIWANGEIMKRGNSVLEGYDVHEAND